MKKLHIEKIILLAGILLLYGCMTNQYRYDTEIYKGEESFLSAVRAKMNTALDQVKPLEKPITNKDLIIGVPSLEHFKILNREFNKMNGNSVNATKMSDTLAEGSYIDIMNIARAFKKSNIYLNSKIKTTDGGMLVPSKKTTVIYLFTPSSTVIQWYISGDKVGKQTLDMDRGMTSITGKINSMLDRVKSYALTDM